MACVCGAVVAAGGGGTGVEVAFCTLLVVGAAACVGAGVEVGMGAAVPPAQSAPPTVTVRVALLTLFDCFVLSAALTVNVPSRSLVPRATRLTVRQPVPVAFTVKLASRPEAVVPPLPTRVQA